jgi:pimeloyl-ACP methyl ester carboxylesterase
LTLVAGGHRLEAAWLGPRAATALVLLHEGLGSVAMWRDWPAALAAASGRSVLAYSRRGYGASEPRPPPWPLTYMHEEAALLPAVLDGAGIERALLVGHSDGGSIALIHAGSPGARPRVAALALLAAHVFCEDVGVASIARARDAFVDGELRRRLARHHGDNVDNAFWGWNRAWLDPDFRRWNIEEYVPRIEAPMLIVQGEDDAYGTLAQVDAIERGARAPTTRLVLPGCGHSPHRDRPAETIAAIVALAERTLG